MRKIDKRVWDAVIKRHKGRESNLKGTNDPKYQAVADCEYLIEIIENIQKDLMKISRFKR